MQPLWGEIEIKAIFNIVDTKNRLKRLEVSRKCCTFAPMNARRERAKAQNNRLNKQLEVVAPEVSQKKDEYSIEIGKFLLDLAKLTFAGVFLTGVMGMSIDIIYLTLAGAIVIALLAFVGFKYIKRGINNKQ